MTHFDEQEWFVDMTADWSWLRRSYFVATWPLWYAWSLLVMRWYKLWHGEAMFWEGVARDYGDRLEELGDDDWISEYRSGRDVDWWERWDD